jgi:hypothetical protein
VGSRNCIGAACPLEIGVSARMRRKPGYHLLCVNRHRNSDNVRKIISGDEGVTGERKMMTV